MEAISIEQQRTDHVFAGLEYHDAIDLANARMAVSLPEGGVTPQGSAYLATFAFRISPEAHGLSGLRVLLRDASSMLVDSAGRSMELLGTTAAPIPVP